MITIMMIKIINILRYIIQEFENIVFVVISKIFFNLQVLIIFEPLYIYHRSLNIKYIYVHNSQYKN